MRSLPILLLIAGLFALAPPARQTPVSQSTPPPPDAPLPAPPQKAVFSSLPSPEPIFTGEVERGKAFDHDIGHGLDFHLDPNPDVGSGWDIEIVKNGDLSDDREDFVAVATPPYHLFNQRYLSTAYGNTAKDSVAITPRRFYFVESPADYKIADQEVNFNTFPTHATSDEVDAADDQARKIFVGRGDLLILDSRITPATEKDNRGTIDWIKFEVRLTFHTGLNFRRVFLHG